MKKIYTGFTFILFLVFNLATSQFSFAQLSPVMNPIQGPSAACSAPAAPVFTASASNSPTSYSWSVIGAPGVIINNPSGAVTSISFPHVATNVTYTISCYAMNNGGPSTSVSYVVTVFETPTVTFSGATGMCQGSSTNISASATIFGASSTMTYSWSPSTGLNTTYGAYVNAQPSTTTNYTVLLTLGSCTNTAQLTIYIYPSPCIVGIESISAPGTDLLVYPNPSSDSFILKSGKDELAVILNEIGQTVRSFKLIAGNETKISGLPGGIYFVVTSSSRKKIVVTN